MPDIILKEENRKKLDGIVSKMVANKESDSDIQLLVEDFKSKYGEKKNEVQNASTTGTQPSKRGFEPFLPQVPTKAPSVLTPKGQVDYQEQVKDFKPVVQKQPPLPKAEKPLSNLESIKNTVYNVANSLKGVLPRLSLTSVDVFEKVIGKDLTGRLASLPRIEFSNDGIDIVTGRTPEQIRNESIQSLDYLNTQVAPTAGIVENVRNFNIPGLAAGVIDAAGGLVSTIIPSALSGGSLLVTEMVGGGLYDYNTAKAKSKGVSTEDLYKSGDADFGVPAAIGGVAYSMERIGLKGFTNAISKKLAGSGFKKALLLGTEWNKEGLTEWVQVGLDEANLALANGLSVEDAAIAAADKMSSVEGLEAYAKGFAGSAAASGTARVVKRLVSPKNKTKASELEQQKNQSLQDLANENIPIEAKNAILDVLENTNEQIDDLVNIDRKEVEQLSESQAGRVGEINEKIENIDLAINDANISESTKTILEKQKQELDSELDAIIAAPEIKLAKPTFDTEESLTEEIRAAEKEFNETGDSAEYELKINDLNTRLENLVPAPEDAEIGKPEEVVEVEPIRQLGTGANVYFETEKYRVNDELKNGKVLLNIQSQTSEAPIANIEFDNANDAVIIAQELNNKFPDGVPDAILIDKYIEQLKKDLLKPQEDAVPQSISSQVLVQPEAPVSEEVEQGKPEAEPKVVTEEGKEEVGSEKTKVYHGADIDFTVEGKRNRIMFTSKNKDYAQYYAKQRSGKLFEFDVEKSKIAKEEYVKNKIKSLGLKTKEGDLVDIDDNLHRLIDPRFDDTAISKEGLDKLFSELEKEGYYGVDFMDENQELGGINEIESTAIFNPKELVKATEKSTQEQTPAQKVEQLRAKEQAELKAAIPNADQYLTDGKVDEDKLTDPKDKEAFNKIWKKYDKLITPLLPKKEAPAPKQEAPAKAEPKLKPRVETRIKFAKAIELFNDISATKGGAKKRTLSAKRKLFLEQNPSIKYIDDNWRKISKQLEDKGLLKKEGNCP